MTRWLDALRAGPPGSRPAVVVTVAATRGSAPREDGARMVVTTAGCHGSIGGGNLEFKAIEMARGMLAGDSGSGRATMRRFPLGPALGQCCGGVVTLMFEPVAATLPAWVEWAAIRLERRAVVGVATVADGDEAGAKLLCGGGETWTGIADPALSMRAAELAAAAAGPAAAVHWVAGSDGRRSPLLIERWQAGDFHVVLFGAGHVGRALAAVLGQLPCTVLWVDERESEFPDTLAANVTARVTRAHEVVIDESPPAACYVVMTHSHALDESICEHVLGRADFRYCGLIGSVTKRRRFEKRMAARGMGAAALARLTCPIGIAGLTGKHPGEIAVAIAAELLALRARDTVTAPVAGVGRGRGR